MSCRHSRLSKGIDAFIARITAAGPSAKRPPHIALEPSALARSPSERSISSRAAIACLLGTSLLAAACDRKSHAPEQAAAQADAQANAQAASGVATNEAAPVSADEVQSGPTPVAKAATFDRSHKGQAAPALTFTGPDGAPVTLAAFRGKPVLLNLWATWCAPCVEELPSLLAMQRAHPEIAVVAVSADQDDEVYRRFLKQHQVDVLTVRDADQKVNAMYGTVQIPETYVIDRQGVMRRKFIGAQDWTGPEITQYLQKL